jgi:hypothetical protein
VLVPIGKAASGDVYFLDPARAELVYRFDHEEQEAEVAAKSLAAFVGGLLVARWGDLASQQELARDTVARCTPARG